MSKKLLSGIALLVVIAAGAGWYAYGFFSKKLFLEDYATMNQYYKQALFFTGQEKREEAVTNYHTLVIEYGAFKTKYQKYHPPVVAGDVQFDTDLDTIAHLIDVPKDKIMSGNLKEAHLELEKVRPIFQEILKRNNISMLAVSLVDFHDAMEIIIAAADTKDSAQIIAVYPDVNEKLKAVEEVTNDGEIQAIRANLDQLLALARENKTDSLPAKAAELKSSFVKVYLKRG